MDISVIISVYNGERYLRESIQSVLNQTYKKFELILINDGSTDSSLEIMQSFEDPRIRIVDQKNKGLAKSLNVGIKQAKGNLIARLDDDDKAKPTRFEEQVAYLYNHPECVLLGSAVDVIDEYGDKISRTIPYTGDRALRLFLENRGNPFTHPSIMMRTKQLEKVGGYNQKIDKYFEDYLLWSLLAKEGRIQNLSASLTEYRVHKGSIMSEGIENEVKPIIQTIVKNGKVGNKLYRKFSQITSEVQSKISSDLKKDRFYKERVRKYQYNKYYIIYLMIKWMSPKMTAMFLSKVKSIILIIKYIFR